MPRTATKPAALPDGTRVMSDDPETVALAGRVLHAAMAMALAPNPGEDRGAYLERMRHARGMTSAQLAEAMGVGESFIWNAEDTPESFAGPLHDGFWQLAADALNLPEDAFLSVPVTFDRAPVEELPRPRSRSVAPPPSRP
jgi:hypothetical protein